jgi:outer membrane lipoprotein-sorting protein
MIMKRRTFAGLMSVGTVAGVTGLWSEDAVADEKGDKYLAVVDATLFKPKTQFFEYEGTIKTSGKADRTLKLAVWMKNQWRLSEFLAPSDVKGTKVLILSPSQMYVYLPAYKKVRRIASHVTDQGFMGMHFTQDDMSITSYVKMYSATIGKDDGKLVTLTLTAKEKSEAPYPKLEMVVDKAKNLPTEIRYFNKEGKKLKTETRASYSTQDDHSTPAELKMVDHMKDNGSTTLVRKGWKVNPDIPDSKFSKRALEEGS